MSSTPLVGWWTYPELTKVVLENHGALSDQFLNIPFVVRMARTHNELNEAFWGQYWTQRSQVSWNQLMVWEDARFFVSVWYACVRKAKVNDVKFSKTNVWIFDQVCCVHIEVNCLSGLWIHTWPANKTITIGQVERFNYSYLALSIMQKPKRLGGAFWVWLRFYLDEETRKIKQTKVWYL